MYRTLPILCCLLMSCQQIAAQNIWAFTSIAPIGQTDSLTIPTSHRFQVLTVSQQVYSTFVLPKQPDFTAFVPIAGSSETGYLSLNHELAAPHGRVTTFDANFNPTTELWSLTNPADINMTPVVSGGKFCSGMITPWGNVLSAEEGVTTSDANNDGYHDHGWLVETNPATRQVVRKLFKLGKMRHENACIAKNKRNMYFGPDGTEGYLFRYVANSNNNMTNGKLFVLKLTSETAASGDWVEVPNSTPDQCNNVLSFAASVGATDFGPIEDVEIGKDNKIYFACKSNGRVMRFKEGGHGVTNCEVFVEPGTYTVATSTGPQTVEWATGSDNLAFDKVGNLWVCHDSGNSDLDLNYVWVVGPTHTTATPKLRLFLSTPEGCEPTGLTFSPDNRFIFMSFQFASTTSNNYVAHDVANKPIVFKKGVTVVIARKEFLGSPANLPIIAPETTTETSEIYPNKMHINPTIVRIGQPINVSLPNDILGGIKLIISDLTGKTIWENAQIIAQPTHLLTLEIPDNLPSNEYILTVQSGDQLQSSIFVVQE